MSDKYAWAPIRTEPAYRVAAQALRTRIVTGEIAVGSVLPSETAMAEMLEVNRSTIREAIRLLEENGIVARKPGGKKLFVTIPTRADLSERMTTAMVLQEITLEELWATMIALEPAAAAAAAGNATDAHITALEANLKATEANIDNKESLLELDLEFHELIADACGNRALQLSREPIGSLFYPAFDAVFSRLNAGERLLVAHTRIVDALKARDRETAVEWMRKHIVDFRRGVELANLDMSRPAKGASH
ncbi:FadR/GntR family transcriptional regulator [Pacificispira sp.]|jgi:DNA-binding FadR family transcriptional regulator|uniref:FadR/GntR family transcriptional regulator n=1 Tax=Pacificispira sp. TaxID=2888761 RepID=UPI003B521954